VIAFMKIRHDRVLPTAPNPHPTSQIMRYGPTVA
jgi:hypothetical protein